MSLRSRHGGYAILVWLLVWSAVTLTVDGMTGWSSYCQFRATTFPTADGVITRSEVTESGDSYQLDVAYDYEVAGQRYTGTRYSYDYAGAHTREACRKTRDEVPVGAHVAVAYDPHEPAEALLRPGWTGSLLMMVWFLTPFNVVMIGVWMYYVSGLRPAFDPADPRSVAPTATGWRVRVPDIGRTGRFGVTVLGITFIGTFAWGCGCGANPPVALAGPGFLIALALGVFVALYCTTPRLEVDEVARVLRLPAEVPFAVIRDVIVIHEDTQDSDADENYCHHCELVRTDTPADAPPTRVATYSQPEDAEALAAWLRERIGLTPS